MNNVRRNKIKKEIGKLESVLTLIDTLNVERIKMFMMDVKSNIESVCDDEQDAFDNMPEGLQSSMYAYAKKYTNGDMAPEVWLLYPMTEEMKEPLYFDSSDGVKVYAFFINVADVKTSLEELKMLIEEACQNE